jgi:prepilin peptidase CpaA
MSSFQWFSILPMLVLIVLAALWDLRSRRIPNWMNGILILSGLAGCFLMHVPVSPSESCLGLVVGFAIPFVLFAMGALGGGDVKLLAGVGAWLGPVGVFKVFVAAALVGMVMVLVQSAKQRRLSVLFRNSAVLTVNLINIDSIGADAVCETGKACRSIERPLPYAVPVLIAVVLVLSIGF